MNRGPQSKRQTCQGERNGQGGIETQGVGCYTYHVALMLSYGSQGRTSGGRVEPIRSRGSRSCRGHTACQQQPLPRVSREWRSVHLQPTVPLGAHEKCFNFFQNQEKKMNFNSKKMFSYIMLTYSTLYQRCKIPFFGIFCGGKGPRREN